MRLSESQLLFLARFSKSPEGKEFLELCKAKLAERDAKLRSAEGAEVHRQQGRALELDEMIADVTEAQAKLTANQSAARPRRFVNLEQFADTQLR